ncbi:hypothetical protein LJB98_05085 [Bacteroidales bacterium OttesenSCG-928-M11]|nr:hypothetical protein [Bacteroidales bacterium OttesenSCG-928-M11]
MIKSFIRNILYFSLFSFVIIAVFSAINLYCINTKIVNIENFKLDKDVKTLLIGDSHVGLSLSPNYIPNSSNQYIDGEHYLFTYFRLVNFIEANPQIETVVLGFSYKNIAVDSDGSLFTSHKKNSSFSKYFMLLGEEECQLLYSNDLIYFRNYLGWKWGVPTKDNMPLILKTNKTNFDKSILPFIGHWSENKKNDELQNFKGALWHFKEEVRLSDISVEYLYKMIDLCKSNDIDLILYTSPLHPIYYDLIPSFYKESFFSLRSSIVDEYNLRFIDYSNEKMSNSYYFDGNHLSGAGAKYISVKVAEDILD